MTDRHTKNVAHTPLEGGHKITVRLTDAQRIELSRLTGKDFPEISIGLQDLADIGDLVAN